MPALRSTWRGVLICWHLDLMMSRAGLWGDSCCWWMGSVCGDKAHKRERFNPCNVCDKTFKSLGTPKQHIGWQHSAYVFVCNGCGKKGKTNNTLNRQNLPFVFKRHHRKSFFNFSIWGKGVRREKRQFCLGPGRGQTFSTRSIGNILFIF